MKKFPKMLLTNLSDLQRSTVLCRVDFNVPLDAKRQVEDRTRLEAVEETIRYLMDQHAKVLLMSHLGRPDGEFDPGLTLDPIVEPLSELLDTRVRKADDCIGDEPLRMIKAMNAGDVGLLENLRFHAGEEQCDSQFSKQLADLADVYVNDAFGASHRSHASITGVPGFLDQSASGFLLKEEFNVLSEIREDPERPFVVLMGGAKISDKFPLIKRFLNQANHVLVSGAMANTFMLARDGRIGDSLVDREMVEEAEYLLENLDTYSGNLHIVSDVVAKKSADPSASTKIFNSGAIPEGWKAMDIGPETIKEFSHILEDASLVFWNGPPGVFEEERFAHGTRQIIKTLDSIGARVVVGGGDSSAATNQMGYNDSFYHVSTGGGASLLLLESGSLPGIESLNQRKEKPPVSSSS